MTSLIAKDVSLTYFNWLIFWCRGADVDVKRLPKRPAPPQFGRKLTDAQKASIDLCIVWNVHIYFVLASCWIFLYLFLCLIIYSSLSSGQSNTHLPRLWLHIHLAEAFWWTGKFLYFALAVFQYKAYNLLFRLQKLVGQLQKIGILVWSMSYWHRIRSSCL